MRQWYALLAFVSCISIMNAQELKYETVIELYKKNSPELKYLKQDVEKSLSEISDYALLDNPEISYEREEISGNTGDEYEQVISVEQKINLLGQPFIKMNIADLEEEALQLHFKYESAKLLTEFTDEYLSVVRLSNEVQIQSEVLETVRKAFSAANERYKEGNLSGFEVRRFQVQLDAYQLEYNEIENEYYNLLGTLLSKIYPDENIRDRLNNDIRKVSLEEIGMPEDILLDINNMQEEALQNRSDLKAFELLKESRSSRVTVEELSRFPELGISGGYKKVSGLGDGFVVGVSLDLPLFNFNGNNVRAAEANSTIAETQYLQKKKQIILQVNDIYNRLTSTKRQLTELEKRADENSILETAVLLYTEGQITLIELIDAAEAYKSYQLLYNQTKQNFNSLTERANLILGKTNTGI